MRYHGGLLLGAFGVHTDFYSTHVSLPFIRKAVLYICDQLKQQLSAGITQLDYDTMSRKVLALETARANALLDEAVRSDYVASIGELLDLGRDKFQGH